MDLSICIFFAFILLFRFAFFVLLFCFFVASFLLFFCFFPGKKQTKSKKKANRKSKINAKKCKWTSPFFSFFFPFCLSIFSHLFCFLFFSVLKFCFLIFHVFSFFFVFFSSLKNIRISYRGGHNDSTVFDFGGPPARL